MANCPAQSGDGGRNTTPHREAFTAYPFLPLVAEGNH